MKRLSKPHRLDLRSPFTRGNIAASGRVGITTHWSIINLRDTETNPRSLLPYWVDKPSLPAQARGDKPQSRTAGLGRVALGVRAPSRLLRRSVLPGSLRGLPVPARSEFPVFTQELLGERAAAPGWWEGSGWMTRCGGRPSWHGVAAPCVRLGRRTGWDPGTQRNLDLQSQNWRDRRKAEYPPTFNLYEWSHPSRQKPICDYSVYMIFIPLGIMYTEQFQRQRVVGTLIVCSPLVQLFLWYWYWTSLMVGSPCPSPTLSTYSKGLISDRCVLL